MCQLVAYIGKRPIASLMLKSLELQEPYFAAQATGLGVVNKNKVEIVKASGHVAKVKRSHPEIKKLTGSAGIGHSRYSDLARDDPRMNTDAMVHPFTSDDGNIALMHNGIITNFQDFWTRQKKQHRFKSYEADVDFIVDSEIAVHLLADYVADGKTVGEALKLIAPQLTGSFLLGAIKADEPETVWIANWHQPCVIGVGDEESMFVSSHIGLAPIKDQLKKIYEPPKNSLLKLTPGKVETSILDPKRKAPNLKLDKMIVKEEILNILRYGDTDFRDLWYALLWNTWHRAFGVTKEAFTSLQKDGVSIVNPYISCIDELIAEGKIRQYVDKRMEGQTRYTPRFAYALA